MTASAFLDDGLIVLLMLVALTALSVMVHTLLNGVPPMPSLGRARRRLVGLARTLQARTTVVELGSGWGSLSLALSRAMPSATVVGYENSPLPFMFSLVLRRLFGADNLRLVRANFLRVSLRDADLVMCYLSPKAMAQLQPKFAAELKPSAVVISSTFALPAWKATRVAVVKDIYRTPIYLYYAGVCRSNGSASQVDIVT